MKSGKKLSLVIPVYFNSGSLPHLFKALLEIKGFLAAKKMGLELVFVDDGSGDDSLAQLLAFKAGKPYVKVIKHTRNFGAPRAAKTGLRFVTGDAFIISAADLQDPPTLIPQMVELWLNGSKFVLCARSSRDDPWSSVIFSKAYYFLLRLLVLPQFPANGYDMALMDAVMLPYLLQSSKSSYVPLLAYWLGYRPEIIYYHRPARAHGRSMWTFTKKVHLFLDVMLGFSINPIRIISGLGALISCLSVSYGIFIVCNGLLHKIPVPGFASLAALISFLLGLVILMLGVIGEYLWRIFEELNRRPESVVEKIY